MDQVSHMWKLVSRTMLFCGVVVIAWGFYLGVAVILKGFCLLDGSTVDFHFFDIANQTLCIAFLLNFWTLQRSFCIGKLPFDTSIYIRPDFLRYLLDGRGYLFLQISLQPSDRWRSYCNFPVCDLLPFYVRTTKRAYNKILLGNKIVFGCANFPSNSSVQQNYPSV